MQLPERVNLQVRRIDSSHRASRIIPISKSTFNAPSQPPGGLALVSCVFYFCIAPSNEAPGSIGVPMKTLPTPPCTLGLTDIGGYVL